MKTQNATNIVKYFTVKNCHKANLKPCEDSEVLYWYGKKGVFLYKNLVIFQEYKRDKGVNLEVTPIDYYHSETYESARILTDCCSNRSKEGQDFIKTFTDAWEIDISLLHTKLEAILNRAEMIKSGILPKEEPTEFIERIHKEIKIRQEALQEIVIPKNWVNLDYYDLVRLGDLVKEVQKETLDLEVGLEKFAKPSDVAYQTFYIASFPWPGDSYLNGLLFTIQRLKALAEKEQEA